MITQKDIDLICAALRRKGFTWDQTNFAVSLVRNFAEREGRHTHECGQNKGTEMRTLYEHQVNPVNDTLIITVMDEPGHGGANHEYKITGLPNSGEYLIKFQNGPISVDGNGVNGLTHEVLLAILADRLRGFQQGPYSTKADACALTHIEEAQYWLKQRTLERMRRGVEGTHTV
ncbi:MAG: hypothetical protein ACKO0Z_03555 [Betaproteobacteria bacterium]